MWLQLALFPDKCGGLVWPRLAPAAGQSEQPDCHRLPESLPHCVAASSPSLASLLIQHQLHWPTAPKVPCAAPSLDNRVTHQLPARS